MLIRRLTFLLLLALIGCNNASTGRLIWDPTEFGCDGTRVTGAVKYNVYGVPDVGQVIPVVVEDGTCGPIQKPTISPLNFMPLTENSFLLPSGSWTLGVESIVNGKSSGVSETISYK